MRTSARRVDKVDSRLPVKITFNQYMNIFRIDWCERLYFFLFLECFVWIILIDQKKKFLILQESTEENRTGEFSLWVA